MPDASEFPLIAQMRSARGKAAMEFLEYLENNNVHLARSVGDDYRPFNPNYTIFVARFLGIDPDALAAEKARMSGGMAKV